MPAVSWRTRPARTMSRWLCASASAGASRRVGVEGAGRRLVYVPRTGTRGRRAPTGSVRRLGEDVRAGLARTVEESRDRLAADQVGLDDLLHVLRADARIPDVFGVHDDHRTVPALGEAAGLVDPD